MADYNLGTGGTLRDALNNLYPMRGLGEYGAMFPPQTGSPQPGGPVPIPRPRPPTMAPNYAPTGPNQAGPAGPPLAPPVALPSGGVNMPMSYPAAQQLYRSLGPTYAQRLGLAP